LIKALKQLMHSILKRFGLDVAANATLFRKVPKTAWYQGDGASLVILLTVQVLTGAVLTLSYSNSIDLAYASVEYITHYQMMGWFIRGLHYWSAGLMVLMLVFHVLRLLLVGGYKAPREGTWMTGVLLFFLVIVMSYSGYVLRWDERGIYAIKVLLNIANNVPFIGEYLVVFIQGGTEINALTLSRFYSVHVILVPLLLLALVAYHLYLVILHGPTSMVERRVPVETAAEQGELVEMAKKSEQEGEEFWPMTMAVSGLMSFLVMLIGIALTLTLGPAELYPEANLTSTSFPMEEWWFWWYSTTIALLSPSVAPIFMVWFPIILFFAMIALPLLDRSPNRGISNRPFWILTVGLTTILLLGLSAYRLTSPWTGWPNQEAPPFPKQFIVTQELERGREVFVKYGCNSCHAVAGNGPKAGPDITEIKNILTRQQMEQVILRPPKHYAMPAYEGRMTPEELKHVIEYVFVIQIQARRP
jgi:ubiquinol-cytochrome c reductase cytochrome b subunit